MGNFRLSAGQARQEPVALAETPNTGLLRSANAAAQPSKYQCDGNDKHDTRGNHQNLEGVIARSVMV
jgi:hypothetical protein